MPGIYKDTVGTFSTAAMREDRRLARLNPVERPRPLHYIRDELADVIDALPCYIRAEMNHMTSLAGIKVSGYSLICCLDAKVVEVHWLAGYGDPRIIRDYRSMAQESRRIKHPTVSVIVGQITTAL